MELDILNRRLRGNYLSVNFVNIMFLRLDHSSMGDKLGMWEIFIITKLVSSLGVGCVPACCMDPCECSGSLALSSCSTSVH